MQKALREGEQKWEHGSNSDGEAEKKDVCKGREVKVKKDEARRSGAERLPQETTFPGVEPRPDLPRPAHTARTARSMKGTSKSVEVIKRSEKKPSC